MQSRETKITIPDYLFQLTYSDGTASCYITKKISVTKSGTLNRYGVIANQDIEEGEYIWIDPYFSEFKDFNNIPYNSKVRTFEENAKLPLHYLSEQVGPNHFFCAETLEEAEKEIFPFTNHSCDPCMWPVQGNGVARRKIKKGEEICQDYATFTSAPIYDIPKCNCGTKLCRGKWTADDWKSPELRERYKGHFSLFITYLIDQDEKKNNTWIRKR